MMRHEPFHANSEGNYGITYRNAADLKTIRHDNYDNYKDSLVPHQLKETELVTLKT